MKWLKQNNKKLKIFCCQCYHQPIPIASWLELESFSDRTLLTIDKRFIFPFLFFMALFTTIIKKKGLRRTRRCYRTPAAGNIFIRWNDFNAWKFQTKAIKQLKLESLNFVIYTIRLFGLWHWECRTRNRRNLLSSLNL